MNIKRAIVASMAKKKYQKTYNRLLYVLLRLMNYGAANHPTTSGETWLMHRLKKKIGENCIIFDVGANVGQYATEARLIFGQNARICSFEPIPTTFSILKKEVEPLKVEVYNFGFADEPSQLEAYIEEEGTVTASLLDKPKSTSIKHSVELKTIDQFIIDHNIKKINFLKVDVEGYEWNVFKGASKAIAEGIIDIIQFEFGSQQIKSHHFLSDISELLPGFEIFRLVQDGLVKVNCKPIEEVFLTTNYVAINLNSRIDEVSIS